MAVRSQSGGGGSAGSRRARWYTRSKRSNIGKGCVAKQNSRLSSISDSILDGGDEEADRREKNGGVV